MTRTERYRSLPVALPPAAVATAYTSSAQPRTTDSYLTEMSAPTHTMTVNEAMKAFDGLTQDETEALALARKVSDRAWKDIKAMSNLDDETKRDLWTWLGEHGRAMNLFIESTVVRGEFQARNAYWGLLKNKWGDEISAILKRELWDPIARDNLRRAKDEAGLLGRRPSITDDDDSLPASTPNASLDTAMTRGTTAGNP